MTLWYIIGIPVALSVGYYLGYLLDRAGKL
jgi:hypothetical protein